MKALAVKPSVPASVHMIDMKDAIWIVCLSVRRNRVHPAGTARDNSRDLSRRRRKGARLRARFDEAYSFSGTPRRD